MKKLGALFLIAILAIVLWALPAGAEKIRLTDAEMDGITAGFVFMTPASLANIVSLTAIGVGVAGPGSASGSLTLLLTILTHPVVTGTASGAASSPPPAASGVVSLVVQGPNGLIVPLAIGGSVP
jgi:hypothetical protein